MSQFYTQLRDKAQQHPETLAVIEGDLRWTYPQFLQEVDRAMVAFQTLNLAVGDRVALMLFNQKEFLVSFFALRALGVVVVPINIQMLPQDIGFVIQNAGIQTVIADSALAPNLAAFPLRLIVVGETEIAHALAYETLLASAPQDATPTFVGSHPGELAFLIYTSGTSGYPKGVMLSEHNILSNIAGFREIIQFGLTDRIVLAIPLFHAFGLIVALTNIFHGGSLSLVPKFNPKQILHAMVTQDVTVLPLVPTLYTVLLTLLKREGNIHFEHLRFCVSGGASLPAALLQQIETALNTTVIEGYGMTETSPVIAVNNPAVGSIPGCVGKVLPNVSVQITREDGSACENTQEGEIWVKGDNVMLGYYNLPEETHATMSPDGWLKTGDLGYFDASGNLYISGRKKDLIIKAGENIAPLPIENVLYQHPGVREAAVIGLPHEKLGETIAACVALHEGVTLSTADLMQHCRANLNSTYIPDDIYVLDELPKNPTGKIVKKSVKELVLKHVMVR